MSDSPSPGPWSYTWGEHGRYEVRDANGRPVAEVRAEADAQLLAAAPELRRCLAHLVASVRVGASRDECLDDTMGLLARLARSPWTGGDG